MGAQVKNARGERLDDYGAPNPDDGVINWGHWPVPREQIRRWALELAIQSHGECPGEPADKCFTARAAHFEKYLRGELEND